MVWFKYNEVQLKYERDKRIYRIFISLICLGLILGFIGSTFASKEIEKVYEDAIVTLSSKRSHLNHQSLYNKLSELNISHKRIVWAQAVVETGHFKSSVYIENNNLFGMKQSKNRPTTCIGQDKGHAKYSSWEDSVLDYAIYQAKYLSQFKTEKDYLNYLRANYAEDPEYVDKVISVSKQLEKYL